MPLLQRYFWTQALWPLIFSLSALALLALLTQSLQTLDLIVENRQSALTFLYITLLALPQLIGVILPLAVFMASLYALNRLNMDSELIVAKASGFSAWQIGTPLVRLGVFAMIAHLIINLVLQPLSFREMRSELLKVRTDIASQMVHAGEFISPTKGLTVYAREIGSGGQMQDVLIYDQRDAQDDGATMHSARHGYLTRDANNAQLVLTTGNIQKLLPSGNLDFIDFDTYHIDLSDVVAVDSVLRYKSSDRFLHELLRPDIRDYADKRIRRKFAAEGHARLAAPLYNIALVLLALCFMIRGEHKRLGYGTTIAICAIFGFVARLSGFALTSAAEANSGLNWVQYFLPIMLSLMCFYYLLQRNRARGLKPWAETFRGFIQIIQNRFSPTS